ncbi:hypothetical protein HHI36_019150 [Cryptolaemus montrouzieri]|uniref:Uncharacterized protein n=1 Tax=Cryptolaemus montrouzieri TaxID=559131 RepID=A0ABD2P253_9CUCU
MYTLIVLSTFSLCTYADLLPKNTQEFRPSFPDPLQKRIPARSYGPPKPVYGVPNKPDDTAEPTTPPNNFRDNPTKFQSQRLPLRNPNTPNQACCAHINSQQNLLQQQLPAVHDRIRFPSNIQSFNSNNNFVPQGLPSPVSASIFNENAASAQLNIAPQNFHALNNAFQRNPLVEIQRSQQLPTQQFNDQVFSSNNNPNNINLNNHDLVNLQTLSFPGLLGLQPQKGSGSAMHIPSNFNMRSNQISRPEFQTEIIGENKLLNGVAFEAKRASSSRRGGKVTAAPARQYLTPAQTTNEPFESTTIKRRRPITTATEPSPTPKGRPNVSVANAFAGRLFLLQPDGRLEPVILRRINPDESDDPEKNNISPAELTRKLNIS